MLNLGRNIKNWRAAKNISQKELAYKVGITVAYLSMVENNAKKPSLTLIEKICHTLEVPLGVFFSDLSLQ